MCKIVKIKVIKKQIKVLELFCGYKSVGKVCDELGYKSTSLDLNLPYSRAKTRGVRDIEGSNKLVKKTIEIINYFNCKYWFIENPQTGLLKKQEFMKDLPYVDCDYCMYGKPYRKRTRIWTNKKVELNLCNKKCGFIVDNKHIGSCGNGRKKYCNKTYTKN